MLGNTHIALGIASSLVLTQPKTVPEVIAAVAGGAIGGWIVDIDCKDQKLERETIYDTIISALFIGALIALDFAVGKGMCQYVFDNWGIPLLGATLGFIALLIVGQASAHRTFTHSLVGLALFTALLYIFCRPLAIPFLIGYVSHLCADLFNRRGMQLLFPLKWRVCLNLCHSNKTANKALFLIACVFDLVFGAYLFASAMINSDGLDFVAFLRDADLFGISVLTIYLVVINVITFLGFQRSWKLRDREERTEENEDLRIWVEFETWLLNFLVFMGGGVGMLLALLVYLQYPSSYNGVWWSFCYTSILFWYTVFCYICNPFGYSLTAVEWLSIEHILLLIYFVAINAVSAFAFYSVRHRRFDEYSVAHTLLWLLGAVGGTLGAIPVVVAVRREGTYLYAIVGFSVMLIAQIIFVMYMLMAGVF